MKKFFVSCALSLAAMSTMANLTPGEAQNIAQTFANQHPAWGGKHLISKQITKTTKLSYTGRSAVSDDEAGYYVFSIGPNAGFVVVSAHEQGPEVLGFADTGTFDASQMPPAMKFWLDGLERELSQVTTATADTEEKGIAVEPLIKTKWSQGTPFNNDCPVEWDIAAVEHRTLTGCVATAMAQVINYHRHALETYDWDNMLDVYLPQDYSDTEAAAVAKLMHDCGVSVDMRYGITASGAYDTDVPEALTSVWGYDNSSIDLIARDLLSHNESIETLRKELSESRPVIISGASQSSGHCFVCDGISEDNLLHINWGWGGSYDGYFRLSAMGDQYGIYSRRLQFITGIQPGVQSTTLENRPPRLMADGSLIEGFMVAGGTYNGFSNISLHRGYSNFDIATRFINSSTNEVSYSFPMAINDWTTDIRYVLIGQSTPADDGEYLVSPVFRLRDDYDGEWLDFLFPPGATSELRMVRNGSDVNVIEPELPKQLSLSAMTFPTMTVDRSQEKTYMVPYSLSNSSDTEYSGIISFKFFNDDNEEYYDIEGFGYIDVPAHSEADSEATITIGNYALTGNYTLKAFDKYGNDLTPKSIPFEITEFRIDIDASNFPDPKLREKISSLYDKDHNGYLSESEAVNVRSLFIDNAGIASLKGVELLPNLAYISASGNDLTAVDLTGLTKLYNFSASTNKINSLTIDPEAPLETLYLNDNELTELNLSGYAKLTTLNLMRNRLSHINLTGCTALQSLTIAYNRLTHFNADGLDALTSILAYGNTSDIALPSDGTIDFAEFNGFKIDRASGWSTGTLRGSTLTLPTTPSTGTLSYNYDFGNNFSATFNINYSIETSPEPDPEPEPEPEPEPVTVKEITLSNSNITLEEGQSATLTATVIPADADNKTLKWSSSNSKIASVNTLGKVSALKPGSATITAAATDGSGVKATCTVTVSAKPVSVSRVTLDKSEISLNVNSSYRLQATVLPANATDPTLTWRIDNPAIASVNTVGTVKGLAAGQTVVIAEAVSNPLAWAICTVTVTEPQDGIESPATDSITITVNGTTLTINGLHNAIARIYATDGRLLHTLNTDTSLRLSRGVYLLQLPTRTLRLAI